MSYGKVLVVDDEEHIIELVKFNLENNGYEVISALDGKEAITKAKQENPDLIVLDLMLPIMDGVEVCKKIKNDKETENISIIMLTAKNDEADKIVGLEIGADDYITKPFSVRELIARIKAVLRRNNDGRTKEVENIIKIGDITISNEKHEVTKRGEKLELTLKEFELLRMLAKNRGKVLSRNFLLDEIWGYDYFGETRTVDVHIRHLRKKIEDDDKNPRYIETIRGIGYKMK
ncbi:alkaline phosphatase synthesis transcriptional regulatory protein PhoP [Gottschalkia purinilytica]|uniref:Alkaline phosphatase synthesis transcriptional regulatory protein PhoP n=1 Tax=Gottschalkia purinilytica TaxID=1503 RepID=A0A0L0WEK3_GOTPU|nr:response regulator transcription factor [Gottschalkia purinilytica]KNF09908.1 alkaline phosphatase synthesis transcriptional regulatory protein PhoP [Gottschalkia purinilytica]